MEAASEVIVPMSEGLGWTGDLGPSSVGYVGKGGVGGCTISFRLAFSWGDGVLVLNKGPGTDLVPAFSHPGSEMVSV